MENTLTTFEQLGNWIISAPMEDILTSIFWIGLGFFIFYLFICYLCVIRPLKKAPQKIARFLDEVEERRNK